MPTVYLERCCDNTINYEVNGWTGSTSLGDVFSITGDTNIINGCYTIVSSLTAPVVTFDGIETSVANCNDPLCVDCCDTNLCFDVSLSAYTGFNGTYTITGNYNGNYYWTGGTPTKYLFYDNVKWCLSSSLGGDCTFYGSNPTSQTCPDLDESLLTNGPCVPTPTPTDTCFNIDFDVLLACDIPTPTPTPTPTPKSSSAS